MRDYAIGMAVGSLFAAAVSVGCCATSWDVRGRSAAEQRDAVVTITQLCVVSTEQGLELRGYKGTGSAIGPRRVLTAAHLGVCDMQMIYVRDSDGLDHTAAPEWRDSERDVMVLGLVDATDSIAGAVEPTYGTALPGDRVCARVAHPERSTTCGVVRSIDATRIGYDVEADFVVEGGNSGAGVYDVQGQLVGVVTRTAGERGGYFTSINRGEIDK